MRNFKSFLNPCSLLGLNIRTFKTITFNYQIVQSIQWIEIINNTLHIILPAITNYCHQIEMTFHSWICPKLYFLLQTQIEPWSFLIYQTKIQMDIRTRNEHTLMTRYSSLYLELRLSNSWPSQIFTVTFWFWMIPLNNLPDCIIPMRLSSLKLLVPAFKSWDVKATRFAGSIILLFLCAISLPTSQTYNKSAW